MSTRGKYLDGGHGLARALAVELQLLRHAKAVLCGQDAVDVVDLDRGLGEGEVGGRRVVELRLDRVLAGDPGV
jgi:hypothetical protein